MLQIRNILVDIILCGPYLVDIIYLSRDVLEKAKGSTALLCPLCRAPMYGPAPPFYCKPMTKRPREDDNDDGGKGPKVPPPVLSALLV